MIFSLKRASITWTKGRMVKQAGGLHYAIQPYTSVKNQGAKTCSFSS